MQLTYEQVCRLVERIDERQALLTQNTELLVKVERQQQLIGLLLQQLKEAHAAQGTPADGAEEG